MGLLDNVQNLAKELEIAKFKALKELAKECAKYENKKIKYINKKPRIFIIKFSDLKNNWSPEFYDFEYQFKAILYVLKHTNPDNLINKWEKLKDKGIAMFLPSIVKQYGMKNPCSEITKELKQDWHSANYTVLKFHPDVIEFVDNLIIGE